MTRCEAADLAGVNWGNPEAGCAPMRPYTHAYKCMSGAPSKRGAPSSLSPTAHALKPPVKIPKTPKKYKTTRKNTKTTRKKYIKKYHPKNTENIYIKNTPVPLFRERRSKRSRAKSRAPLLVSSLTPLSHLKLLIFEALGIHPGNAQVLCYFLCLFLCTATFVYCYFCVLLLFVFVL